MLWIADWNSIANACALLAPSISSVDVWDLATTTRTPLEQNAGLLDSSTGEVLHTLGGHQWIPRCVAFSADGWSVASVSDAIRLWNVETGKQIDSLETIDTPVEYLTFSSDGKYLLGCSGSSIYLWDAASFRLYKTFTGHAAMVWWVDISPDSSTVVSAGKDRTVKLWDVATGQEKASFDMKADVRCVQFSATGDVLAAADGRNVTIFRAPRK